MRSLPFIMYSSLLYVSQDFRGMERAVSMPRRVPAFGQCWGAGKEALTSRHPSDGALPPSTARDRTMGSGPVARVEPGPLVVHTLTQAPHVTTVPGFGCCATTRSARYRG